MALILTETSIAQRHKCVVLHSSHKNVNPIETAISVFIEVAPQWTPNGGLKDLHNAMAKL